MRINNTYSLYKTEPELKPFIDSPLCFAYQEIPLGVKGVYVFYDDDTGDILYVGKSKDLRKRIYAYAELGYGSAYEKINKIINKHNIGVVVYKSDDNYLLEDYLIKQYKPPYNKRTEL